MGVFFTEREREEIEVRVYRGMLVERERRERERYIYKGLEKYFHNDELPQVDKYLQS